MKKTALLLFVVLLIPQAGAARAVRNADFSFHAEVAEEKFVRTELYFGRSRPRGGTVAETEWQTFVDEYVTPRFPDGLTVLEAYGQWRGKYGSISKEESKVILLLYPRKQRKAVNAKIEEIRNEYKKRFDQESVMRIDITKSVTVSF